MFPIIAGSDTTAVALKMAITHIAHHPQARRALTSEIHSAISAGTLSSPPSHDKTTRLPYLQATIWESLRAHPPFGGLIMKQTGADGDFFQGRFIPPGTRVAHSTWAVTHDVGVFGADVDVFRPERWLDAGEEARAAMRRQTELVFGSGRFGCPGRAVVLVELGKLLVEVSPRRSDTVLTRRGANVTSWFEISIFRLRRWNMCRARTLLTVTWMDLCL